LSGSKSQSIQARLLNYSHDHQENHNHTLVRYGIERLMYRLSSSPYSDRFILKGAMLFVMWMDEDHRPTQDLDLLGIGNFTTGSLISIFKEVCTIPCDDDGVEFIKEQITIDEIREAEIYQGQRIKIPGWLGGIKLNVSVDIGFGDAIVPRPKKMTYPVLLDLPPPRLKTYPKETVVAEKLDAIILLGLRNSRMKDYYDLWTMAKHFRFDATMLARAIKATLKRRGRKLPTHQLSGLTDEFFNNETKQRQWKAFLKRTVPHHQELDLPEVVHLIQKFLSPVLQALIAKQSFDWQWSQESDWVERTV
jgi:hypothetical protein